jgi:light-regulated signal transduction histidine kinase (bacteriophytochrome)
MISRAIWEFVSPQEREKSREAVRRKIAREQPLEPFIREYAKKDGTRLLLEIHENLIHDSRGAVVGIRSSMLDVTERERSRQALADRTAELARSNAELEQFAYVASHDLQEPLRKILAFGDRLKASSGAPLGDQGRDYLERMQKAAGRMQALINDLLALSRIRRKGQPFVAVDLAKVVQDVASLLEIRIEQLGARLDVGDLPTIDADPLQMSQLFQNLIANALKFHRQDQTPMVKIHCALIANSDGRKHQDGLCQISIEDNGIGFDEKYVNRIFQVFQRLHSRAEYEGTGVGLAICRHIVERHCGSLTAKSAPGNGATFIVTLPISQPIEGTINDKS